EDDGAARPARADAHRREREDARLSVPSPTCGEKRGKVMRNERTLVLGVAALALALAASGCAASRDVAAARPSDEKPVFVHGSRASSNASGVETGDVVVEESPGELETTEAPPTIEREVIVFEKRPSPAHVWIHGHWAWHGRWVWVPGHWHEARAGFR